MLWSISYEWTLYEHDDAALYAVHVPAWFLTERYILAYRSIRMNLSDLSTTGD